MSVIIRLDVDNVGDSIELSLINGNIQKAQSIHNNIQNGMSFLKKEILKIETSNILMMGCDDILFNISENEYSESFLINMSASFSKLTGYTLSIGVSLSLHDSLYNLKKAKLSGRNKIVSTIR